MKHYLLIVFVSIFFISCATRQSPLEPQIEQSINTLPKINSQSQIDQEKLLAKKLAPLMMDKIKEKSKDIFWAFSSYTYRAKNPWYGSNLKPLKPEFFAALKAQAAIENLGKISQPAISIKQTSLRAMPTNQPIFYNPKKAGEGFPFDYLQLSSLPIGTPLFLSHYSNNGAWALVRDDNVWGWVSSNDIKVLTKDEAKEYAKNDKWLVALSDGASLLDGSGHFIDLSRVGMILPFSYIKDGKFVGKIYTKAGLVSYELDQSFASIYPLKMNDENIQKLTFGLLGQEYGWGGLGGLRDCSLFTKDFLAGFGIWLPRNSKAQSSIGDRISLKGLSQQQKIELIKSKAKPYLTLVHLPGHIMLYVGLSSSGEILVLHDAWGLRTYGGGRAILGGINLTTLFVGIDRADIPDSSLLINKIDYINILN